MNTKKLFCGLICLPTASIVLSVLTTNMQATALPMDDQPRPHTNSPAGGSTDHTTYPGCLSINGGSGCQNAPNMDPPLGPKKSVPIELPQDRPDGGTSTDKPGKPGKAGGR